MSPIITKRREAREMVVCPPIGCRKVESLICFCYPDPIPRRFIRSTRSLQDTSIFRPCLHLDIINADGITATRKMYTKFTQNSKIWIIRTMCCGWTSSIPMVSDTSRGIMASSRIPLICRISLRVRVGRWSPSWIRTSNAITSTTCTRKQKRRDFTSRTTPTPRITMDGAGPVPPPTRTSPMLPLDHGGRINSTTISTLAAPIPSTHGTT
mmetsp:Transcript_9447/g.13876  ORF Transcript_9447/g.13876 Transcript_9447/m.13876 type:complete len:210 (-) Transcript_9447:1854-2483(-)